MIINLIVTLMLANPIAVDCKECAASGNQVKQAAKILLNRRMITREKTRSIKRGRCR